MNPIVIDGSLGEGGGQVLRTALALSIITGKPFRLENVRARRSKPGLLRQHLASANAAAVIGQGVVEGAELGSKQLTFTPGQPQCGDYFFSIGSAGSTTLVVQTALPVLLRRSSNCRSSCVRAEDVAESAVAELKEYLISCRC